MAKKITFFIVQIFLVFICYFITELLVLGTKKYIPSTLNKDIVLLYQILILPITFIWVNFYLKKLKKYKIKFKISNPFNSIIYAFSLVFFITFLYLSVLSFVFNFKLVIYFNPLPFSKWLIFIILIFVLATVEEIIFRKLILEISKKLTKNKFILSLINGFLFLGFHVYSFIIGEFNLFWAFGLFFFAFFLTTYVLKYNNLLFVIFFHFLWNISTSLFIEDEKYKIIDIKKYDINEDLILNTCTFCFISVLIICSYLVYKYESKSLIVK